jgi:hypothetical protein
MTQTITEQTGWIRDYPKMICQNFKALARVNELSFDVNNTEFIEYFRCRTGVVWNDNLKWLATSDDAENHLLTSTELFYITCKMIPFGKERESMVTHNRILKGKLQDCWELFTSVENSSWEHKYINLMN